MKKFLIISLLLLVFAVSVYSQNGVIRDLSGDVTLKPAGSSDFTPAAVGDTVGKDTIVSTGFRSTTIIVVGNSLITVRPLTRLSLSEIQRTSGGENVSLSLQTGRIRVDVNPPAGAATTNFTVRSPSATASVRGTSFEIDAHNLQVISGKVLYAGTNGFWTIVNAGNSSMIGANGNAWDPAELLASLLFPPAPVGANGSTQTISPEFVDPNRGYLSIDVNWK